MSSFALTFLSYWIFCLAPQNVTLWKWNELRILSWLLKLTVAVFVLMKEFFIWSVLSLSPQFTSFVSKNPDQAWIWQLEGSVASLSSSHVPSLCVLACQCPLVIPPLSHPSSPLCSSPSCLGQSGLTVRPMTAWIILPVSLAAFSITGIWIVWVSICCHP